MKTVSVTEFKTHCLRLLAEVEQGGESLKLTRHDKEVARVLPPEKPSVKVSYEPGGSKDTVWIVGDLELTPEEAGWDLEGKKFRL